MHSDGLDISVSTPISRYACCERRITASPRERQALPGSTSMRVKMKKMSIAAIVALALVPALAACGQGQSQPQAAAPPPPKVTVAKPVSRMIADQDEYVGRFVAVESVEVRARVSGYLAPIHFPHGPILNNAHLLFIIDR